MSRLKLFITAPQVYPDEFCIVHNYRRKHGKIWEKGRCVDVFFRCNSREKKNDGDDGWWKYTVILNRRDAHGNCMRLYATDAGIRPITDTDDEV